MIEAECIIPTSDGCSIICPIEASFAAVEGALIEYRYGSEGLIVEYGGIGAKIPISLFTHMLSSVEDNEELGPVSNLHIYGKINDYEAFFFGTLAVEAEEFIKAKGVAAYLASNP